MGTVILILLFLCMAVLLGMGRTYTAVLEIPGTIKDKTDYHVWLEKEGIVALTNERWEQGKLYLTFRSISQGRVFFRVEAGDQNYGMAFLEVHPLGIITYNNVFGDCRGGRVVPISVLLLMQMIFYERFEIFRRESRGNLYQEKNIKNVGLLIFLGFSIFWQILQIHSYHGLVGILSSVKDSAGAFSVLVLPIVFLSSVLVTIKSIQLMHQEGKSLKNMLGIFLGLTICIGTILPKVLGEYLQRSTLFDVHNEQGMALYVEMFLESMLSAAVVYFECILLGTIIFGVKAARHMPAFDKDYILILGCRIKKDGTLPPLLRGRADRAIDFAGRQSRSRQKELVFVPSGGKGEDEIMAEGEAIGRYLQEQGIPKEQILIENQSDNTRENFLYSMELIRRHWRERGKVNEPKIAFSTTNYHVFRSGVLAGKEGIAAEGIGSRTKSYFWINAFIREFVAVLYEEKKAHARVLGMLCVMIFCMVGLLYYSAF